MREFIATVINRCTPKYGQFGDLNDANWYRYIFTRDPKNQAYGTFLGNLLNLVFIREDNEINLYCLGGKRVEYSIITLNYDLIIENIYSYLRNHFLDTPIIPDGLEIEPFLYFLKNGYLKLHGSVNNIDTIVPPIWNKSVERDLTQTWQNAGECLRSATKIRILGYSFPSSDNYMKYLMVAALSLCKNLKSIDIICHDRTGEVYRRYKDYFDFDIRFKDDDILNYLTGLHRLQVSSFTSAINSNPQFNRFSFSKLEEHHNNFMADAK